MTKNYRTVVVSELNCPDIVSRKALVKSLLEMGAMTAVKVISFPQDKIIFKVIEE